MSWLCWNMRGLGNQRTVRELGSMVRNQDPTALFLAETWVGEDRLKRLCRELLFDHFWIVPQVNKTGCLALFWKKSVHIEVISSSPNHIDTIVGSNPEAQWRFIGIYGFAEAARKPETWSLIKSLHLTASLPWLCVGDFNEILWSHEKLGLGPRQEGCMKAFCNALDECGLKDLGYLGDKFTWKGKRQGGMVFERLDRAVANNQWSFLNPGMAIHHLNTHSSDHKPIVITPEGIILKLNRPFKFEKMWLSDGGCNWTVKDAWGLSSPEASMAVVAGKLKNCDDKLLS